MLLDDDSMTYQPTVFFNDFWLMRKHLVPVNETVTELPLHLSLSGMGNWKFMLYVQMDQSFNMQVMTFCCPLSRLVAEIAVVSSWCMSVTPPLLLISSCLVALQPWPSPVIRILAAAILVPAAGGRI